MDHVRQAWTSLDADNRTAYAELRKLETERAALDQQIYLLKSRIAERQNQMRHLEHLIPQELPPRNEKCPNCGKDVVNRLDHENDGDQGCSWRCHHF